MPERDRAATWIELLLRYPQLLAHCLDPGERLVHFERVHLRHGPASLVQDAAHRLRGREQEEFRLAGRLRLRDHARHWTKLQLGCARRARDDDRGGAVV